jgi:hypothetical protein
VENQTKKARQPEKSMTGFTGLSGCGRISTVERCLACEADGEQGDIVEHALPLSTLYAKPWPNHTKA